MRIIVPQAQGSDTTRMDDFLSTSYHAAIASIDYAAMRPHVRAGDVRPHTIVVNGAFRQAYIGGGLWRVFNGEHSDFHVNHVDDDDLVIVDGWYFPNAEQKQQDEREIAAVSRLSYDSDPLARFFTSGGREPEPRERLGAIDPMRESERKPYSRFRRERWTVATEARDAA